MRAKPVKKNVGMVLTESMRDNVVHGWFAERQ
jgi:hypothetical protein